MIDRILRTEPVRLYAIGGALVALGAYFIPSGAWPLVIALLAAVLGLGEGVRSQVWSQAGHELDIERAVAEVLPEDPEPIAGSPRKRAANGRFA